MARLTLQCSAAPPEVAAVFRSVPSALADSDFYLAGGTALALRIRHRLSVDLGLFSPTLDAVEPLLTTLRASLPGFVVTATAPRTLEDICAMKLAAIASRGSRKDFVDLWFMVKGGLSLAVALDLFTQKYAAVDVGHVVRSLAYFDDAEREPELRLLRPAPWPQVKSDLLAWVEDLLAAP